MTGEIVIVALIAAAIGFGVGFWLGIGYEHERMVRRTSVSRGPHGYVEDRR